MKAGGWKMADGGWTARSVLECGSPLPLCLRTAMGAGCVTREPPKLRAWPTKSARGLAQSKTWRLIVTALCVLAVSCIAARAQNFSIDWFTIDGGGGTSTGGVYSVSGTIGQPDAGAMSGGNYSLQGGFWGIISAVQTPGAPLLSIARQGSAVRVYWLTNATGFVLDQSLTVTGAWSQVAFPYSTNATEISITVPSPTGNKFYRLRKP